MMESQVLLIQVAGPIGQNGLLVGGIGQTEREINIGPFVFAVGCC